MQHAHANAELYDGFHSQPTLLIKSPAPPSLHSYATPYVPYMYLDLAHACIMFAHCLAQLQDEGAVNVHHLNTPNRQPLPNSLLSMLKDALRGENSSTNTSLNLGLPALQAEVMAYMSRRRAMSDIRAPGGLATAVAGSLGLHATHGHTQVLAVLLLAWLTLLG